MTKKTGLFYLLHFGFSLLVVGLYALIANTFWAAGKDWLDVLGIAGLATLMSLAIRRFWKK